MAFISDADKRDYENIINEITGTTGDFSSKVLTWRRLEGDIDRWAEGTNQANFKSIRLRCLCNYNFMRSWPITYETESGGLDRQSIQIMLNKQYLKDLGLISDDGYFMYDPELDRFILDGKIHKPFGDTPASMAFTDDLFFTFIIKREEQSTGEKINSNGKYTANDNFILTDENGNKL